MTTQISTRELLYLEDTSKIFDTIQKTCQHAMTEVTDSQIKSMLQDMSTQHKQWIQSSSTLVTKTGSYS